MSGQIIYRSGNRYTQEEKFAIVKDYLESNLSRNAIVKKYQIGQGTLIAWLRIFGVEKNNENNKSVMVRKTHFRGTTTAFAKGTLRMFHGAFP